MTRYLITSAIPYVNGVKHLGNLVGSLLPADVHARFRRQTGAEVLFICGTDEHGTPTELSAAAAGKDARTYCNEQHAIQADIYRRFGLSFDHFGRSSSAQNRELTQHFYRRLDAAGLIDERDVPQVWSPKDGRFLPDRYIDRRIAVLRGLHEGLEFRRAAAETRALWVLANTYVQEQAPCAIIKSDPARAAVTTRTALNLLALCAVVGWNIIPSLASHVLAGFGEAPDCPSWPAGPASALLDARKGQSISRIEPLVRKLTETEISQLENRFSGAEG